jgi:hypothetical protein
VTDIKFIINFGEFGELFEDFIFLSFMDVDFGKKMVMEVLIMNFIGDLVFGDGVVRVGKRR